MTHETPSRSQILMAYRAVESLAKRAVPTLDAILRVSELKSKLRPYAEKVDEITTMLAASAEHIEHPKTGQAILKAPDQYNKDVLEAMQQPMDDWESITTRLTKADLPRLPEWSDDEAKQTKAIAAREDLANIVADLGPFFTHVKSE